MSILCVLVKEAHINEPDSNFNTYVVLKIGSVKSTTLAIQGLEPSWREDFCFELNEFDTGLYIELWNRGTTWDTLLGVSWLPLVKINHSTALDGDMNDFKILLESELLIRDGEIVGTHKPTSHYLVLNVRMELLSPNKIENEALEVQQQFQMLNEFLEKEGLSLDHDLDTLCRNINSRQGELNDPNHEATLLGNTNNNKPSLSLLNTIISNNNMSVQNITYTNRFGSNETENEEDEEVKRYNFKNRMEKVSVTVQ